MAMRRGLIGVLLAVVAAGSLATAERAGAAFNMGATACEARPVAYDTSFAFMAGVFGYDNGNGGPQTVNLGSDNIVLQPPNFRAAQPTTFLPGRHEAAWTALFDPVDQPELTWVLTGVAATTSSAVCGGGPVLQPDRPPALSSAGSAAVGDVLTVDPGTWRGIVEGQVLVAVERCAGGQCGAATDIRRAATLPTYTVQGADAGYELRLVAMMVTMHGWSTALSAPVVVPGPPGAPPAPPSQPLGPVTAPLPLREPAVQGVPVEAGALTADHGDWVGSPIPALATRWQRCDTTSCSDIAGATGESYVPTADDVAHRLRVVVTASADGLPTYAIDGTVRETAASAPTAVVAAAPPPPPPAEPAPPASTAAQQPGAAAQAEQPAGTALGTLGPVTPRAPRPVVPRPTLGRFRASPAQFRVGPRTTPLGRGNPRLPSGGTTLSLTLGQRSWVRIDVERVAGGRWHRVATLTRVLGPGSAAIPFMGRLPRFAGGALPPGRYRLSVTATDHGGRHSPTRAVMLRILR
jgi:hypothetical protein